MYRYSNLPRAKQAHIQRWNFHPLIRSTSSLKDIMATLATRAAANKANQAATNTTPAFNNVAVLKNPFSNFTAKSAQPMRPQAGGASLESIWAKQLNKPVSQRFEVDAPVHTRFESSNPASAGASIRETMQKLAEQAKAKTYNATNQQNYNNPFGQARPLRNDTFSSLNRGFNNNNNANQNNRVYPGGMGGGGGGFGSYPPRTGTTGDPRHNQQLQKQEHRNKEMSDKINVVEQYPPKDRFVPPSYAKKSNDPIEIDREAIATMVARNNPSLKAEDASTGPSSFFNNNTGRVEINVSALKAEMLRKKQYEEAEKLYIETAKKARATVVHEVVLPAEGLTIRELASKLSMRTKDLTRKLEDSGALFSILDAPASESEGDAVAKGDDRIVDADSAELVVLELGFLAKRLEDKSAVRAAAISERPSHVVTESTVMVARAPVVCVMGHVDHGKTTLLDTLRKYNKKSVEDSLKATTGGISKAPAAPPKASKNDKNAKAKAGANEIAEVAGSEAGGITQKLSAFSVEVSAGRKVMFLDTPGHAAFSSMRNHGAVATDLVILVVAIDDGVRPQTLEALKMAKDANCSIIVVLNKIDKIPYEERTKERSRVLTQLLNNDLIAEEFGGDVQVVEVAGRTGEGIGQLMESLLLQAEVLELQAAITGQAEAVVLDANMEKGKGVVADILVRWGALNVGDPIVVGGSWGKVKTMFNDKGEPVKTALPSNAVRLLGLRTLPSSGQEMLSVESENIAKEIADRRLAEANVRRLRDETLALRRAEAKARAEAALLAGDILSATAAKESVEKIKVNVVIKADGVGTLEALKQIVQGIASRAVSDVEIVVVSSAVGDVSTSDVELVAAGGEGLILAFNVGIVDSETRSMAKVRDVNIVRDNVIYRLEDELVRTMLSHLPKERSLEREGIAKVQKVFNITGNRAATVAGVIVQNGRLRNKAVVAGNAEKNTEPGGYVFRVIRAGKVVLDEATSVDLKRIKDTVHEVEAGVECGFTIPGFTDFQEDDEIECLKIVWTAPTEAVLPGVSGTIKSDRGAKTSDSNVTKTAKENKKT